MSAPDPLDRYLTEQVVGPATLLTLGPGQGVREVSDRALWLEGLGDRSRLLAGLARSLGQDHPAAALAGQPLDLVALPRLRRRLLAALWLGWSALLAGGVWALARWSTGGPG